MNNKMPIETQKMILNNKKFSNIHCGERCFILGNGPSLKKIDLGMLGNEQIFTVNNFHKIKNYKEAHTNYHLWMDFAFFNMREDMHYNMDEVLMGYDLIAQENPICFFPTWADGFLKEQGLHKKLNAHYLYLAGLLPDNKDGLSLDICSLITSYATVTQYAIAIAIYMGFSRIYLLGCDATNIIGMLNTVLKVRNGAMHAYENDDVESLYEEVSKRCSMSDILFDQYLFFLGYEKLYDYCKEKGIELYNCSSQTLITSIPKISFEEVF